MFFGRDFLHFCKNIVLHPSLVATFCIITILIAVDIPVFSALVYYADDEYFEMLPVKTAPKK
jgi:hypothetical protein